MTKTWLEPDGRRTVMSLSDKFAIQFAIKGNTYNVGIFLMGGDDPSAGVRVDAVIEGDNDELALVWSSGHKTDLGTMAPAFMRALRSSRTVYFHWRNGADATIQEATLPLSV